MDMVSIAMDGDGKEHVIWIILAPFCGMWFVKNGSYFPGETNLLVRRGLRINVVALPMYKRMSTI